MNVLLVIDAVAFVFILFGFHLAFRQNALRRLLAAVQAGPHAASSSPHDGTAAQDSHDEFASVLRMVGIMIMAFSFTAGAFANLIAYYTAISPN